MKFYKQCSVCKKQHLLVLPLLFGCTTTKGGSFSPGGPVHSGTGCPRTMQAQQSSSAVCAAPCGCLGLISSLLLRSVQTKAAPGPTGSCPPSHSCSSGNAIATISLPGRQLRPARSVPAPQGSARRRELPAVPRCAGRRLGQEVLSVLGHKGIPKAS